MMDTILEIRTLCKRFEPGQWVIDNLSLTVSRGSLVCVLGPSGCGKTTLLRLICGFETPDRGEVVKEGEVISRPGYVVPPECRRIGMVFQDYALFPHLTVAENVGFGFGASKLTGLLPWRRLLSNRGWPFSRAAARHGESGLKPDDLRERLAQLFELTGLAGLERRYPHEISGGQQQRVALARALAHRPHLVLLDEPFSNLDANLRRRIRDEVRIVLDRSRTTSILVTHDQEEAMNIADRIAVMNEGRLEQVGPPEEILHRPASRFVAGFVGQSSFIPGHISGESVDTELGRHPLQKPAIGAGWTAVEVLVRPNYLQHCDNGHGTITHVADVAYQGTQTLYTLVLPSGTRIQAALPGYLTLSPGDSVSVRFRPPEIICYPAQKK
ncbi:MAG: ABC transporter ATP-binding protein [SAR324 cluster bacterium]|nr:ABC transporter ATP-binding protein [SAR324 cluster bacterium]